MGALDNLDWITAEKFCELIGESITNLANLRAEWDQGLVWVKVSERKIMYSIRGYNTWVEKKAQAYQKASGLKLEKYKSISHGKGVDDGSRSHLKTLNRTSVKQLRLEKS